MKTIKTYVIWLLLLCLPLQTWAATSMLSCATTDHAAMQPDLPGAAAHCNAVPAAERGHCNAAGTCAATAALVAAAPVIAMGKLPTTAPIAYVSAYASDYYPDGLERPPHRAA